MADEPRPVTTTQIILSSVKLCLSLSEVDLITVVFCAVTLLQSYSLLFASKICNLFEIIHAFYALLVGSYILIFFYQIFYEFWKQLTFLHRNWINL